MLRFPSLELLSQTSGHHRTYYVAGAVTLTMLEDWYGSPQITAEGTGARGLFM